MSTKAYVIERDAERGVAVFVVEGASRRPLTHVVYHSPDGFECGYGGSGPADLALAILADYLGESVTGAKLRRLKLGEEPPRAWQLHQDFKREIVARLDIEPGGAWVLEGDQVAAWLAERPQ